MQTGIVGELLVTIRLFQYGIQAAPPLIDTGNDLIAIKGEIFRAIQVKATAREYLSFNSLPDLYHILALVKLEAKEEDFLLDESKVFLLSKDQVNKSCYAFGEMEQHKINQELVDRLFS